MRSIIILIIGILSLSFKTKAQSSIMSYHVAIGYNKTSNIIFPYAIKSVDRGNNAVLVQKAKGVDNILQVKAGRAGFEQTNLTVITSDGQFYSFVVDYTTEPSKLNISFAKDSNTALMAGKPVNEAVFDNEAAVIAAKPRFLGATASGQMMRLLLHSIWLKDHVEWFVLRLSNRSLVDYTPGYIRFFVRDRKRGKRTAAQETEITPIYKPSNETVAGRQADKFVFAFAPFTIPATQELAVQVSERGGGRSLVLHVNHRQLLKARPLPD